MCHKLRCVDVIYTFCRFEHQEIRQYTTQYTITVCLLEVRYEYIFQLYRLYSRAANGLTARNIVHTTPMSRPPTMVFVHK